MWDSIKRREYLTAVGASVALAGCGSDEASDKLGTLAQTPQKSETLVVPTDGTTTVSPTRTPGPTKQTTPTQTEQPSQTSTAIPTSTPTATATEVEQQDTDSEQSHSPGDESESQESTSTPTPTSPPTVRLVIEASESQTASNVKYYEAIVWYNTGRLVLKEGTGFGLEEVNS